MFISGGSVKATGKEGDNIGNGWEAGEFEPITPKNRPDGEDVQLVRIPNPNSSDVTIGDKSYPANQGSGDTTLYAYLTKGEHKVRVGSDEVTVGGKDSKILVTADVTIDDKVYDGGAEAACEGLSLSGALPGSKVSPKVESATFADANAGADKDVRVILTLTGDDAQYYTLENPEVHKTATISKADAQLRVKAVPDKTYSDERFKLTVDRQGDGALAFESSDEKVLTVDGDGEVTMVGAGSASVTVTVAGTDNYESGRATITVTINGATHVLGIAGTTVEKTVGDADFAALPNASVVPGRLTYSSSNERVATVDGNGTVHIVRAGTTTITVTMEATSTHHAVTEALTLAVAPRPAPPVPPVPIRYAVELPGALEGGTVLASPERAVAGQIVTVTAVPAEGYETGEISVVNVAGRKLELADAGENARSFRMPGSSVKVSVSFQKKPDPEPIEPAEPTTPDEPIEPTEPTTPDEPAEPDTPAPPAKPADGTAKPVALASAGFSGKAISLKWGRVKGAAGYEVYAAKTGAKGKLASKKHLVKTLKATKLSATLKKVGGKALSAKGAYKIRVRAYRLVGGKKRYLASAPALRVVGKASKARTNVKKVTVSPKRATLKVGAGKALKAKLAKVAKGKRLLSSKVVWRTTDAAVATVSAKGKLTAKKKGSCTVYAIAANGKRASVKVTVG